MNLLAAMRDSTRMTGELPLEARFYIRLVPLILKPVMGDGLFYWLGMRDANLISPVRYSSFDQVAEWSKSSKASEGSRLTSAPVP